MLMTVALALCGPAYAREGLILTGIANQTSNISTATPYSDVDANLNRDTPTAGSKGATLRTSSVDARRTTGDTTTSFTPSAFNETATRIIDSSTPIRGIVIWATATTVTQFSESTIGYGYVGISVYGKTAANLRQGYLPVKPGVPLVINDIFWYNTTGSSVSVFVESTIAGLTYHMQVIR